MTFALLLVPILGIGGATLDFVRARTTESRINAIADAAALAAVGTSGAIDGRGGGYDETRSRTIASRVFSERLAQAGIDTRRVASSVAAVKSGSSMTVTITYQSDVPTTLSNVLGVTEMKISGRAVATTAVPQYVDVVALVDASGSMGIGATRRDQALMDARLGCAFACHIDGGTAAARAIGAQTRFDVVRNALGQMIVDAEAVQRVSDQFRFSVYSFSNTLHEVQAPTADLTQARRSVAAMEPAGRPGGGTNFKVSLGDALAKIPTGGSGASPTDRKVFVLLFTDGISDDALFPAPTGSWYKDPRYVVYQPMFSEGNQYIQGFDHGYCDPIKRKGAAVMTLTTEYVVPPSTSDQRFITIRDMLKPRILANMESCASDTRFAFRAEEADDIHAASARMFQAVLSSARLAE